MPVGGSLAIPLSGEDVVRESNWRMSHQRIRRHKVAKNQSWLLYPDCKSALAASAKASPAVAAGAGPSTLEAVLAVHGTVASRLERDSGLLSAPRTDHACALRWAALISAAATGLFVLLGLAACFAALRRWKTTFAEEVLIVSRKREWLPAIATHELLIFSHISLSFMLQVGAALGDCLGGWWPRQTEPLQSPLNSLNHFLQ
jgi:hypothetical protein